MRKCNFSSLHPNITSTSKFKEIWVENSPELFFFQSLEKINNKIVALLAMNCSEIYLWKNEDKTLFPVL